MKNSEEWWEEVKCNQFKLLDWLKKQYHGEVTASHRIRQFLNQFQNQAKNVEWVETLEKIAVQEEAHAEWIGGLLSVRGVEAKPLANKNPRYWRETLEGIEDWETGCAVGAHAEKMRLERIAVISSDGNAPEDIRQVFQRILPQEEFHERSFRKFSSKEALDKTKCNHNRGRNALGLEI